MNCLKIMLFLFSTIFLLGCNENNIVKYEKVVTSHLENIYVQKGKKYESIIVMPGQGCPGCITSAELYFKQNVKDTNTLFIFTNLVSVKELKLKTGVDIEKLKNVLLDYNNAFTPIGFDKITVYPVHIIYNMENNAIVNITVQKP